MKAILFTVCSFFLLTFHCVSIEQSMANGEVKEKLKPTETWVGISLDDAKLAAYPASGMIGDDKEWQRIWSVWHPDVALPAVDFSQELVLVAKVKGPNRMRLGRLVIDDGNVTFQPIATKRGGPGFGHLLARVPRSGLKSVNGVLVPAAAVLADSIEVTMLGTIETGLMAIGGETTGTTMTCDNIVWELQLDPPQQASAEALNGQKVRVTGQLAMKPGVEVSKRWIVTVGSIGKPVNEDSALGGMPKKGRDAFVSITTVQSGGIAGLMNSTTIKANGRLSKMVQFGNDQPTNQMNAKRLAELHQLVRDTDWSKVPAHTRSRNGADRFQFDITIETKRGSKTYSIDEASLPNVQPLDRLINLFR